MNLVNNLAELSQASNLSPATVLISTFFNSPLRSRRSAPTHIAAEVLERLMEVPSAIALIEGPSGSGKSTLLNRITRFAQIAQMRIFKTLRADTRGRGRVIDHLCDIFMNQPGNTTLNILKAAADVLTVCGLGEPALWLRRACALSDSEQARFAIACALARAGAADQTPFLIVIDEFLSTLDRITAQATARALSRLARSRPALRVLAATAHSDLGTYLEPTLIVRRTGGDA